MSLEDYHAALKPKIQASWNLHELLPKNLDFFIMLSSGTGVIGRGGLSNYATGNTYQDALARHRVSNGMKATSLDLGIVLSVGYVALVMEAFQRLIGVGYALLKEEELHAMLDELCDPSLPVASALKAQVCLGFEPPEIMKAKGIEFPDWVEDPLFKHLFNIRVTGQKVEESSGAVNYKALLVAAGSRELGESVIVEATIHKLAKALSMSVEEIDASQPLHVYGVDSLVAVELRTWFLKEMGAEIAVFDIMGDRTIRALASLAAGRSSLVKFGDHND
jgi:aryl carrier-like protein